ncbi:MAG: flagellar biosynthesis protein FlgH, partial [Zoogloea sp.]|nr:flagellar biosynthesis protein FlgH [Zoogloea sp.]
MKLQRMFGLLSLALAGCASLEATPPTAIHQPMSIRPEPRTAQPPATGSIFQQAYSRPLFEDRRARFVGDIITVRLEETTSANKASSADSSRTDSTDPSV